MIPIHETPMETASLINIVISVAIIIGVYKNKIDTTSKVVEKYAELDIRLARLEEKINLLINNKIK